MLLLTTSSLPDGLVVKEAFTMVLINKAIEVSNKGVLRGLLEKDRNEYQEALDFLASQAPQDANESPRVLRRLQLLREWSHEQSNKVFP